MRDLLAPTCEQELQAARAEVERLRGLLQAVRDCNSVDCRECNDRIDAALGGAP